MWQRQVLSPLQMWDQQDFRAAPSALPVPSVESMVLGVKNIRSISLCHWGAEGTRGRPLLLKQSMKQRESQTHVDQAAANSTYGTMHPVI